MPISGHHDLWMKVGRRLLAEYESWVQSTYLDSSSKGKKCEAEFRKWLQQFLPKRVEVIDGVIVDKQTNPTPQRDVIIFDHYHCPIFKEDQQGGEDINILPIEGVVGLVEVNASVAETKKLIADVDKIFEMKRLQPLTEPPKKICYQLPPDMKLLTHYPAQMCRFGYVFAHDTKVSLETLAEHIAARNLTLQTDYSVDGVFVLKKGMILHGIPEGWTTTRMAGGRLFSLEAEAWDVLLTMVSMINQHLALGAAGNVPPLEEYFHRPDFNRREDMLKRRKIIGGEEYARQPSRFATVT